MRSMGSASTYASAENPWLWALTRTLFTSSRMPQSARRATSAKNSHSLSVLARNAT
jgi:hypothetical protein